MGNHFSICICIEKMVDSRFPHISLSPGLAAGRSHSGFTAVFLQVDEQLPQPLLNRNAMFLNLTIRIGPLLFQKFLTGKIRSEGRLHHLHSPGPVASLQVIEELFRHLNTVFLSHRVPGLNGESLRIKHQAVLVKYNCFHLITHVGNPSCFLLLCQKYHTIIPQICNGINKRKRGSFSLPLHND